MPPLVAAVRSNVLAAVPSKFIPVLLPVAGGVVAGLAAVLGVDLGGTDLATAPTSVWESSIMGILIGAASVGVHQIKKQQEK